MAVAPFVVTTREVDKLTHVMLMPIHLVLLLVYLHLQTTCLRLSFV
jgi:hypothetical protein